MNPTRFYQGFAVVLLLHIGLLFFLFHDKIVKVRLLSSVSLSLNEAAPHDRQGIGTGVGTGAGLGGAGAGLEELEAMWQEQIIDELFKGPPGPANHHRVSPPPRREVMEEEYLVTRAQGAVTLDLGGEASMERTISGGHQPKIGVNHGSDPTVAKPDPTTAKPDPTTAKPDPTAAKPDPTTAKPDPTAAKPDPTAAKPDPTVPNVENEAPKPVKPSLGKPKMVLVLTESRHGSTWLMDVLSWPSHHVPVFEPLNLRFLKMYAEDEEVRSEALEEGFDIEKFSDWREVTLSRICLCDWYGNMIPGKNNRLFGSIVGMAYKSKRLGVDYKTSYRESHQLCQANNALMVPKTIRLYDISKFYKLSEFGCPSFKIIHLVRDPRAVILSRMLVFHELYDGNKLLGAHLTGNQATFPEDYVTRAAGEMCSHHLANHRLGLNPPAWLEGRYTMVRYEDISRSPDAEFRELLHFVGIPYTRGYRDYVYNTTHLVERGIARKGGNYDVDRETSTLIDKWRGKLLERHWRNIEETCAEMMKTFGYKFDYYEG